MLLINVQNLIFNNKTKKIVKEKFSNFTNLSNHKITIKDKIVGDKNIIYKEIKSIFMTIA